jgi:hypothetical protein
MLQPSATREGGVASAPIRTLPPEMWLCIAANLNRRDKALLSMASRDWRDAVGMCGGRPSLSVLSGDPSPMWQPHDIDAEDLDPACIVSATAPGGKEAGHLMRFLEAAAECDGLVELALINPNMLMHEPWQGGGAMLVRTQCAGADFVATFVVEVEGTSATRPHGRRMLQINAEGECIDYFCVRVGANAIMRALRGSDGCARLAWSILHRADRGASVACTLLARDGSFVRGFVAECEEATRADERAMTAAYVAAVRTFLPEVRCGDDRILDAVAPDVPLAAPMTSGRLARMIEEWAPGVGPRHGRHDAETVFYKRVGEENGGGLDFALAVVSGERILSDVRFARYTGRSAFYRYKPPSGGEMKLEPGVALFDVRRMHAFVRRLLPDCRLESFGNAKALSFDVAEGGVRISYRQECRPMAQREGTSGDVMLDVGQWRCVACTFVNQSYIHVCLICSAPRSTAV